MQLVQFNLVSVAVFVYGLEASLQFKKANAVENGNGSSSHSNRPSQWLSRDDVWHHATIYLKGDAHCSMRLRILTKALQHVINGAPD